MSGAWCQPGLRLPHGVPRPHFPPERSGHTPPLLQRTPAEVVTSGQGDNTPDSRNPNRVSVFWKGKLRKSRVVGFDVTPLSLCLSIACVSG